MQGLSKADKIHVWIAASVTVILLLSYILYKCFANFLIEAIYNGQSLQVLNNLIKYQHKYPLEHYLQSGDLLFGRLVFLTVIFLTILLVASYMINRLIFSNRKLMFFYVIAFCLLMQSLVFFLNPKWGIFYTHGFFRGSISYQIQEGGVPPQDPLFAWQTVGSPWGGPWLSAQVSQLLNVTPFRAYSIVNAVTICLVAFLVYKVSGLVFKNKKANICSVLFAIFGATIFPRNVLTWLESLLHSSRLEWRAVSVFHKFIYASADSIGLVCLLLFIYSSIRIIKNKNIWPFTFLLLLSIYGCGFLYPPMLPGLVASITLFCLSYPFLAKKGIFPPSYRPVLHIAAALVVALALLVSYFLSVAGASSGMTILRPQYLWPHLVNFVIPLSPILLVIFLSRKLWFKNADIQTFTLVSIVIIANIGIYFSLNLPAFAEYKFFLVATFFIALIGGIAFNELRTKLPRFVALILLLLFMLPSIGQIIAVSKRHSNNIITNVLSGKGFLEKGTDLYVTDTEENEMYEWIKNNTDKDRIFLDTTMKLPIYAKRRLLIGPGEKTEVGYSMLMDQFKLRSGYDDQEYNKRMSIVRNVFAIERTLDPLSVSNYLHEKNILVIVRTDDLIDKFEFPGFKVLFQSSGGRFQIIQFTS